MGLEGYATAKELLTKLNLSDVSLLKNRGILPVATIGRVGLYDLNDALRRHEEFEAGRDERASQAQHRSHAMRRANFEAKRARAEIALAKRAAENLQALSAAPPQPTELMKRIAQLEEQVEFLSKQKLDHGARHQRIEDRLAALEKFVDQF